MTTSVLRLPSLALAPLLALAACDDPGRSTATTTTTTTTTADTIGGDTSPAGCANHAQCAGDPAKPFCNLASGACEAPPRGNLIGTGDGTPASVTLVELYRPRNPVEAVDLEFHPDRNELWVLNRPFEVQGICSQSNFNSARCRSMESSTTILFEPGTPNQDDLTVTDDNAWHFMRRAPALAMGALDTFATCGEAFTGNFEDDPITYIGPTLWSADLEIYGVTPPGGNGSHLDMLHETPWCMGIAHERDNVYWLFNGEHGAIDRVDFHEDHGPGADDHSDGEVHRYIKGALTRLPSVPSGLVFHHGDNHLYIVDSGSNRVIKMDTRSGTAGGALDEQWEELAASGQVRNSTVVELVLPGVMTQPSGLAIHDDVMYVSDHQTSRIHAFDRATGAQLRTLDTGLPAGTLAGLEVGPDDKLYFTDMLGGAVYRIDPK
ncbi:MAG: hypothetical protein IT385_15365 [Deltaproteobacteria bacterium]|nr:hypothetical protein [Deltaproteobacteria bacterium]